MNYCDECKYFEISLLSPEESDFGVTEEYECKKIQQLINNFPPNIIKHLHFYVQRKSFASLCSYFKPETGKETPNE